METFVGAVLVADITGFTRLTEKLSTRGSAGVELLTNCMNDFFSKVGRRAAYGGSLGGLAMGWCAAHEVDSLHHRTRHTNATNGALW